MGIPSQLLDAFDSTGRIQSLALFEAAVAKDILHDTSGSDNAKCKRLSLLLARWNIRPRTLRFYDGKVAKGYLKAQFAWVVKTEQPLPDNFA